MLFNSIDFAVFFLVVYCLYWAVFSKEVRARNLFLLVVSYVFYGWWDVRFLALMAFSSAVDFFVGQRMELVHDKTKRKFLLILSLLVNIGLLGFFKYFNFFIESFSNAFTLFGRPIDPFSVSIILPVGISFYTFQTLSYTIDVYRRKIAPTADLIKFFAFVSFFPQLVAGPIERAKDLLPQFDSKKTFNYTESVDGIRQILLGLVKKIVIADNCAPLVNTIFENYTDYSGGVLALGAILFSFQIYGDFSGYSDIAIGVARMLGFNLSQNFAYPYFSRDIAEFWRRWHISLTSWFKDYVYIPLGGSRGGKFQMIRNTFIIFLISGFWHGANWTFIVWGAINALLFLPLQLAGRNRKHNNNIEIKGVYTTVKNIFSIIATFLLVSFTWIFFRSDNIAEAGGYVYRIFATPFDLANFFLVASPAKLLFLPMIVILLVVEWFGRRDQHGLERFALSWPRPIRWSFYLMLTLSLLIFSTREQEFIYFQF